MACVTETFIWVVVTPHVIDLLGVAPNPMNRLPSKALSFSK